MPETPGCNPRLTWRAIRAFSGWWNCCSNWHREKVLVISRTIEKAEAIDEALRRHLTIKTGIFHEGLTLLQRDRNAAWFAEPDGARLLDLFRDRQRRTQFSIRAPSRPI